MNFNPDQVVLNSNELFFAKLDAAIKMGPEEDDDEQKCLSLLSSRIQSSPSLDLSPKDCPENDYDIPIEFTDFLPPAAEIKSIGADILQGFDLPDNYF